VHQQFDARALWQSQSQAEVIYRAVPSGHYIPEELPDLTAEALHDFMR